jgi:hypothetical protein
MHEVGAKTTPGTQPDPLEVALREIDIAIELVLSGRASVVQLSGLEAAETAAALGLAQAQAAGVEFALQRSSSAAGAVSLRIGPRLMAEASAPGCQGARR